MIATLNVTWGPNSFRKECKAEYSPNLRRGVYHYLDYLQLVQIFGMNKEKNKFNLLKLVL